MLLGGAGSWRMAAAMTLSPPRPLLGNHAGGGGGGSALAGRGLCGDLTPRLPSRGSFKNTGDGADDLGENEENTGRLFSHEGGPAGGRDLAPAWAAPEADARGNRAIMTDAAVMPRLTGMRLTPSDRLRSGSGVPLPLAAAAPVAVAAGFFPARSVLGSADGPKGDASVKVGGRRGLTMVGLTAPAMGRGVGNAVPATAGAA